MNKIKLCSIAAMAENRVIGKDGDIPWHISEDFKFFKKTTMGHPLIMGRKCFESLPGILPGRPHIVISRTPEEVKEHENLYPVSNIDEALDCARKLAEGNNADQIFIAGGGEIYKQTMDIIDYLYLTIVHKDYEGDTHFPEFNRDEWKTISEDRRNGDPDYTFFVLER